jgi:hypothetical protein
VLTGERIQKLRVSVFESFDLWLADGSDTATVAFGGLEEEVAVALGVARREAGQTTGTPPSCTTA